MIYINSFKLPSFGNPNPNAYPFHVFRHKLGELFVFDRVTVIYGNNGSGKSTLLNIIASMLKIKGAEQLSSDASNQYPVEFLEGCSFQFAEDEPGRERYEVPDGSLYIKSEDILYEIKKIQQEAVLREGYLYEQSRLGLTKEQIEQHKHSWEMEKKLDIIKFANEKYSNGETSMQIFEQYLEPNALYLLDEPETSLSPANQIKLAEDINQLARYFHCQFIIATHSPFMLGTLDAKIYNMDAPLLKTSEWYELDNVRFFYEFFKSHKGKFE